jgi:predicted nucleotidyltransferase
MRKDALRIMKILKEHKPFLIGSVWRGTIRRGSDIDITVCHDVPDEIVNSLEKSGVKISRTGWTAITKKGKTEESFHIYVETYGKQTAEIVVRSLDEANRRRKCEVFGDELKGLNVQELEGMLEENPGRKFIPA